MKKGSAKRVSSLPSNAEFNLGGLYHALRIATVRSSDSLWVPFDKEGKCCKVIHSPTQPQYVETICCLLYTNDELHFGLTLPEHPVSLAILHTFRTISPTNFQLIIFSRLFLLMFVTDFFLASLMSNTNSSVNFWLNWFRKFPRTRNLPILLPTFPQNIQPI